MVGVLCRTFLTTSQVECLSSTMYRTKATTIWAPASMIELDGSQIPRRCARKLQKEEMLGPCDKTHTF